MNGRTSGVVALLGGVALIYLAYTGHLDSAWRGLKGECSGARNDQSPAEQAKATVPSPGLGTGGQADVNAGYPGTFYPAATGGLMAGDGRVVNDDLAKRARFLAALAALGVTLILVDRAIPRAGTIIAGSVFFFWIMQSGGASYLVGKANDLIGGLTK